MFQQQQVENFQGDFNCLLHTFHYYVTCSYMQKRLKIWKGNMSH